MEINNKLAKNNQKPTLNEVEILARKAGELLRLGFIQHPGFNRNHKITRKGTIDLVTEIDLRSEALILGEIQSRFPNHHIASEESGESAGQDSKKWYIDPLDGTINFAHGVPIFAVSIAYEQDGELQLGVVYDPLQEECFAAETGRGAFMNGKPIHVSPIDNYEQSLLVTGFSYDTHTHPENNLDLFSHFSLLTQGVRRLGTAALDLSYVAAGRLDGFWQLRLSPWDLAAGALIVKEAGGIVTDLNGGLDYLSAPYPILAANPHIHPQILKEILAKKT